MIPSPFKTNVLRTLPQTNIVPGHPPAMPQPSALRGGKVDFENLLRNSMTGLSDMTRLEAHIQGLVHRRVHQPMQNMQNEIQAFRTALHKSVAGPNGAVAQAGMQGPAGSAAVETAAAVQAKAGTSRTGLQTGYDYESYRRASAADFNRARIVRTPGSGVDKMLPSHARSLAPAIEQAAERFGLNPELIVSVIKAESNFNPKAVSKKGAMGLMQLMPDTARAMGAKDPFSAQENIMAGSKYLKGMQDRFGDRKLALAAYNAGPGKVEQYGGVPPYMETRRYVEKVLANLSAQ